MGLHLVSLSCRARIFGIFLFLGALFFLGARMATPQILQLDGQLMKSKILATIRFQHGASAGRRRPARGGALRRAGSHHDSKDGVLPNGVTFMTMS